MYLRFLFSKVLLGVLLMMHSCRAGRKWDYEPISITSDTSDPSQIKIVTKIERIGRGSLGISANVEWKYTTDETTTIEAIVFRSSSGAEADYKLLPWSIPKQPFYDYLNTYYKDVIMKIFGQCSNVPQFEGKFQPPWPVQTYVADKCELGEAEGLPEMAPPGFYKIIFNLTGEEQPSWGVVAIFKLKTKMY